MKIHYIPSRNELVLIFRPIAGNPSKEVDHFKVWLDDEGHICALALTNYIEVPQELRKTHIIQLGGLWKGITISDDDITGVREELLRIIEEKFSIDLG